VTIRKARLALTGKLIFGNENQIRALQFLREVNECAEKLGSCLHQEWNCPCTSHFDDDVVRAALDRIRTARINVL